MSNSNKSKLSDTGESKMSKATKVYQRLIKKEGIQRRDVIAAFIEECDLTKAGSATYYNLIKKKLSKTD